MIAVTEVGEKPLLGEIPAKERGLSLFRFSVAAETKPETDYCKEFTKKAVNYHKENTRVFSARHAGAVKLTTLSLITAERVLPITREKVGSHINSMPSRKVKGKPSGCWANYYYFIPPLKVIKAFMDRD